MLHRKILYTGGAGGLGLPAVLTLLDKGASVVVLDRDENKIEVLKDQAKGIGGNLLIKQVDLADEMSLRSAVLDSISELSGIDTLINNAAIYPAKPFDQFTVDEYRLVQKVNVESAVICAQAVLPHMKE